MTVQETPDWWWKLNEWKGDHARDWAVTIGSDHGLAMTRKWTCGLKVFGGESWISETALITAAEDTIEEAVKVALERFDRWAEQQSL